MCGIAGFIDPKGATDRYGLEVIVARMAQTVSHRGPDDHGIWVDPDHGIALGHRRLSILDLSPAGHQPMESAGGRFVISFNGEIYNCEHLRQQLRKANPCLRFRGHSDTEVMLAAFEQWGIETSLQHMNGMFSFAAWDRDARTLVLARDRLGEKPLYYGTAAGVFLFGSELKALRAHPAFAAEIDRDSLARYLQFNCVPAPYSIYRGIHKLLPGTILRYHSGETAISRFWSLRACVEGAFSRPFQGTESDVIEECDSLLCDAVRLRMYSDVPVGAFLSGGIDSSLVAALMQEQSNGAVRTFTIGFDYATHDEAAAAREVARHLGTEHTELYATSQDAIALVSRLPEVYDEPFADSSQIPTLLVSKLARQHVTVTLSGDGGDEVFGGYNRYIWGTRLGRLLKFMPDVFRNVSANTITALQPQQWDSICDLLHPILPSVFQHRTPGYKLHKLARLLFSEDYKEIYARMSSHWLPSELLVGRYASASCHTLSEQEWPPLQDFASQAMYLDTLTYLPDDVLAKVDRATMAFGLENRIPYLDHRVLEFAWRLRLPMKIRSGHGKWILRRLLERRVPARLVDRAKMGFAVPLDAWLRTSLRDWAETLLASDRLKKDEFFDSAVVRTMWEAHLQGQGAWEHHLWDVLMFQSWLDAQSDIHAREPIVIMA